MISVILTCYNSGEFLDEAIKSLLTQTFTDIEIIGVDDGSDNDTFTRLNAYSKQDSRLKVYRKHNEGSPSAAKNYGVKFACGDYIMFLDHDDYLLSDTLELCHNRIMATDADVVLMKLIAFKGNPPEIISEKSGINHEHRVILSGIEAARCAIDWTTHGYGLWKKQIVKENPYDVSNYNGDEYTTVKMLYECQKVAFCDGVYMYRHHEDSITRKFTLRFMEPVQARFMLYDFLKSHRFPDDDLNKQQYSMYCALRFACRRFFAGKGEIPQNQQEKFRCEIVFFYRKLDVKRIKKHIALHVPGQFRKLIDRLGLINFIVFESLSFLLKKA